MDREYRVAVGGVGNYTQPRPPTGHKMDCPYMKSSSISLTELYVGFAASSSSSSSAFRNESYERAAFSAFRASASSRSAFFYRIASGKEKERLGWVGITYLGGGGRTFDGILAFDSLDLLRFVVDHAFDFRLV